MLLRQSCVENQDFQIFCEFHSFIANRSSKVSDGVIFTQQ